MKVGGVERAESSADVYWAMIEESEGGTEGAAGAGGSAVYSTVFWEGGEEG